MSAAWARRSADLRPRGFSLVEVLVALLVGLFLISGVAHLYLGIRHSQDCEETLAGLQSKGHRALETIARDARMAGFAGCTRLEDMSHSPNVVAPGVTFSRDDLVSGTADDKIVAEAVAGTDLLRVRRLSAIGARVVEDMTSAAGAIHVASGPVGFTTGDIAAIADCASVDVFRVDAVEATGIQPNAPLSKTYLTGSEVMHFRDVTYFVGLAASGERVLRVGSDASGHTISGVEDIEVAYGEDLDDDGAPDRYQPGQEVTDWSRVKSLRVRLLLAGTADDHPANLARPVIWRGNPLVSRDGRLRDTVTATIALRNRLP